MLTERGERPAQERSHTYGGVFDDVDSTDLGEGEPSHRRTLLGLCIHRLPLPAGGVQEHTEAGLRAAIRNMGDMDDTQVCGVDTHTDLLPCLARRCHSHRLLGVQLPGRQMPAVSEFVRTGALR